MEKLSGSYEALVQRRYVEQIKHLLILGRGVPFPTNPKFIESFSGGVGGGGSSLLHWLSSWAKLRISQYWEWAKDPFPTNPIKTFYCVMSNEVRHLLIQSKGVKVPLSNLPQKDFKSFTSGVGWGESVHLLDLKRRPLANSARGDTFWKKGKNPFQPTRSVVPKAFCEGPPIQSKGLKDPSSNFPQKGLKIFWVELEEGNSTSSI